MTERPKRPLSAYMLWLSSVREQIKSENPGIKVTDIAKKAGEIWKTMEDKTEWQAKALKAKEKYIKDLESYIANRGGGELGKKTQKRRRYGKNYRQAKLRIETSDDEDSEEDEDEDEEDSD